MTSMLTRRGLIVGSGALAAGAAPLAAAAAAVTPLSPGLLRFDVLRNDSLIGQHVISLTRNGAVLLAAINVRFVVTFGPVTLYRYSHTVREEWRDGIFERMESNTNDDGTSHNVRAERTVEGVVVRTGSGKRTVMPMATIPLTHWNYLCMSTPLFNPQTGEQVRPQVLARGEESVSLADGRAIRARRYSLSGDVALDDWYDRTHTWVALRSTGSDGSTISYRRAA